MSNKKILTPLAVVLFAITGFLTTATPAVAASAEKVLYSFKDNGKDGTFPYASLIFDANGNLYGTTTWGGASGKGCHGVGCGAVFQLSPGANGKWTEAVLYSFKDDGMDGSDPFAGLIVDGVGNLYGTTLGGGAHNYGTVFELMPNKSGSWTEAVLHSFAGYPTDGEYPYAGLIFDAVGNLYGTTYEGSVGAGTVFLLTPGAGTWTETVLYSFGTNSPDGGQPRASLIFDAVGNLYSTMSLAARRGGSAVGLVFRLTPGAGGSWTEKVLYGCKIQGCPDQGVTSYGSVIFDKAGNLYSTTTSGGAYNRGVVFQLTPKPSGKWTETVIHSFGSGKDGSAPQAGLVRDRAGKLYGTTPGGGAYDGGTVFRLTFSDGQWKEKVLHSFGKGKDGAYVQSGLIFDAKGNLYGTTTDGGAYHSGTVFEVTP